MSDVLVVLQPLISASDRAAVLRAAPATQAISDRVFLTASPVDLRSMAGVAHVLTAATGRRVALPALSDPETLFVEAWLSNRGPTKRRVGEGLDWDTPPLLPPDRPR